MGDHGHKRIMGLRCFERVHTMIVHGFPLAEIQRYIQHERLEAKDMTAEALTMALLRYRDSIPGDILAVFNPQMVRQAQKQYADKLEELRRLDIQYEALRYEFDLAHAKTRETGRVGRETLAINREITSVLGKMHTIKMDLGIVGSQTTRTVEVSPERLEELRQKYGDGVASAFADPVSRSRIVAALNSAMQLAELQHEAEKKKVASN